MRRALSIWAWLGLAALGVVLLALLLGSATGSVSQALSALIDPDNPGHRVIMGLRVPRVAAGFAVGALLAVAGSLLQVLMRNPLAEPYVLGVSGGAALAAMIALSFAASALVLTASCALGAALSLTVLLIAARREFAAPVSSATSERLILAGVMLAALWGALLTLALSLAPGARVQSLIFWLMGDLGAASIAWPGWVVLALVVPMALADAAALNLLARGDEHAFALGVDVGPLKRRVVVLAALASGAAVSIAGTVGFVGLLAPHAVRTVLGNDQRLSIPASALVGGSFVVLCDTAARTVLAPMQLPVGAITALVGAPLFLFLMRRRP